jgi:hypothetical protein
MKDEGVVRLQRSPFAVQRSREHTPSQSRSPAMLGRSHQATARHAPLRRQCPTPPTALRPSTTGSGMGLVIVAELVTLQVGTGSRFSIQLLSTNPFLTDLEEVTRELDRLALAEIRASLGEPEG